MGRSPSSEKTSNGVKKGPWTAEEDQKLVDYVQTHGHGRWRTLPKSAGLKRCGKSCRLRWTNYLRPDIKRGKFSLEEEDAIIHLHKVLGNKWSAIASRLPGRTDNEIKNYWNTHIRKKLLRMGIDPVTHNPRLDVRELSSILNSSLCNSMTTHQLNASSLLSTTLRLLNPELLNLATTLLSCHQNTASQFAVPPPNLINHHHQQSQVTFQSNPVDYQSPNAQYQNEGSHVHQPPSNLEQISSDPNNFSWQNILTNLCQEKADQPSIVGCNLPQETVENQSYLNNIGDVSFGSILSTTPSSSSTPFNSTSTNYVNGCTEDEKDSYCSNWFFDNLDQIELV